MVGVITRSSFENQAEELPPAAHKQVLPFFGLIQINLLTNGYTMTGLRPSLSLDCTEHSLRELGPLFLPEIRNYLSPQQLGLQSRECHPHKIKTPRALRRLQCNIYLVVSGDGGECLREEADLVLLGEDFDHSPNFSRKLCQRTPLFQNSRQLARSTSTCN